MIFSFQELLWFYTLAIFFLLVPGVLVCLAINPVMNSGLLGSPVKIIAFGFCFSLLLNYIGMLGFSFLGISLRSYVYALSFLTLTLAVVCILLRKKIDIERFCAWDIAVLLTALTSSIILYFNGGVIDLLADGWWHMSLIREIMDDSTLLFSHYHLMGHERTRSVIDYPMLWHANVALLGYYVPVSLPKIWHLLPSFNIWFVLFAYYLLARCFSRSNACAAIAVLLFCISYGGLNSYFRVMGWPGNIAYIGWYLSYFLFFTILEQVYSRQRLDIKNLYLSAGFLMFLVMCGFITMTHGVPMALFAISMAFLVYSVLIAVPLQQSRSTGYWKYLRSVCVIFLPFLIIGAGVGVFLFPRHISRILGHVNLLHILSILALLMIPLILLLISKIVSLRHKKLVQLLFLIIVSLSLIDYSHLSGLLDSGSMVNKQRPYVIEYFNSFHLIAPKWEHQLRGALMFSGIVAVAISCFYMISGLCDRKNLFLFSCAILSFLCLISPLMFNLVTMAIHSSSAYRIHMLIFSPIIMAMVIQHAMKRN